MLSELFQYIFMDEPFVSTDIQRPNACFRSNLYVSTEVHKRQAVSYRQKPVIYRTDVP